jgi:hypothetical protein
MKRRFWTNLWTDLRDGENLEVYATFLVALVFAILGILGKIDLEIIISAVLAVLSVEAISLLTNRHQTKDLTKSIDHLSSLQESPSLSAHFEAYESRMQNIRADLGQADEVWILSRTCRRLWSDYQEELRRVARYAQSAAVDELCGLRLLFLDPENGALDMVSRSAEWSRPEDSQQLKGSVESFIEYLVGVQEHLNFDCRFEVRVIDHLPAWTLIFVNPRKDDGVVYVEMATYRSPSLVRPCLVVQRDKDNAVYRMLLEDFELMWKAARTVVPPPNP